jgi:PAS domain S-box-containing protein
MMVWMADVSGAVTFVNRKWLSFTGRRLRDELGDGWAASVHPEDLAMCLGEYRAALADQRPFVLEYRLRRSDNVYRWITDYALPLYEDRGAFAGYVGTCVDVTPQREGTAALERTIEHLRLVADHADEMIYRLRLEPRHIEYMSPGVAKIMGLTPDEFLRAPDAAIERVHAEDRSRIRELMAAVPDPAARGVVRWQHDDGRIVWAEHRRLPVYDRDGNLVAIDGVARDITRQKELEQERDAQIAMLDGLIAHMQDGVLAETADQQVAVVNHAFLGLFGLPGPVGSWRAAAALHPLVLEQLANPDECCPRTCCGEDPAPRLQELRLKDGRTLEQEHFTVQLEDARTVHVWQFRDITVRKKEEEELRTSRHRLRDLSAHLETAREEERRQLARALHDEVGQLLTGIRLEVAGAVERFRQTGTPSDFPIVDRLQAAVGLVDLSIATVQRITSSLRSPVLEHLGLVSAIRWEAALFERRTGIRCRVSSRPARIESRCTTILYRILLEALTNVARHANAGTVWIDVRQSADRLVMEVRDNGRGISDEALENPETMGLLGMRERALSAGGHVRISRRASGGTSVTVTLPIEIESETGMSSGASHA